MYPKYFSQQRDHVSNERFKFSLEKKNETIQKIERNCKFTYFDNVYVQFVRQKTKKDCSENLLNVYFVTHVKENPIKKV